MNTPLVELVIRCPLGLSDILVAALFEAGATGVEERTLESDATAPLPSEDDAEAGALDGAARVALVVYSADAAQLAGFEAAVRAAAATAGDSSAALLELVRGTVDTNWENEWLRHLRPVPIGDRLVVQPLGDQAPLPRDRRVIVLRPSWAFGDGSHPTTQLAGDAVERYCIAHPGCRVLDVGAGSGVLGLVALASGAAFAQLIDVAPEAVAAARENAQLNSCTERCVISDEPLAALRDTFDLVVANINESTLLALAEDLGRVTAPAGLLLLTGLVTGDTAAVEAALARQGFAVGRREPLKDWVLLELARRDIGAR